MKEALGLVETRGLSNAVFVADAMVKTANISIIDLENTKGLGFITIKISGDVGAVNAAVTAGKQVAIENNAFVSAKIIPRPSNSIGIAFCQPKDKQIDSNIEDNNPVEQSSDLKPISLENITNESEKDLSQLVEEQGEIKEETTIYNGESKSDQEITFSENEVKLNESESESDMENSKVEEKKPRKPGRKKKEE